MGRLKEDSYFDKVYFYRILFTLTPISSGKNVSFLHLSLLFSERKGGGVRYPSCICCFSSVFSSKWSLRQTVVFWSDIFCYSSAVTGTLKQASSFKDFNLGWALHVSEPFKAPKSWEPLGQSHRKCGSLALTSCASFSNQTEMAIKGENWFATARECVSNWEHSRCFPRKQIHGMWRGVCLDTSLAMRSEP